MQVCEMPKNDIFLAGPRSWKTSIFSTFQKVFQNDENYHQLTTGHLKCKYLFIWVRNMQVCEMPKMTFFSQGRGHENYQFFSTLQKVFQNDERHHQLTPVHMKCKYLLISMKNMQVCEMPKNDTSSQVMKLFNFFDFSKSLLNWWKPPPVDPRTLEM